MRKVNVLYAVLFGLIVGNNCSGGQPLDVTIISVALVAKKKIESGSQQEIKDEHKLEIFYKKKQDADGYDLSARLLHNQIPIAQCVNISDYYEEIKKLCDLKHTGYPYNICGEKSLKMNFEGNSHQIVKFIEHTGQTEELLDMPSCFPWMCSDTIVFSKAEWDDEEIATIYNPEKVASIKALFLSWPKKPVIVRLIDGDKSSVFKIMDYSNGAYIHWQGLKPTFVGRCVGMPFSCAYGVDPNKVEDPHKIEINLDEDKKYLPTYQRNKWGFRAVMAAVLLYGGYWLIEKLA